MHDVSNNLLPSNIQDLFLPTAHVHSYNTFKSWNSKEIFLKNWCEIVEWDTNKARNLPKRTFSKRILNLLLALLESEDSYVDLETMTSKLKMHDG